MPAFMEEKHLSDAEKVAKKIAEYRRRWIEENRSRYLENRRRYYKKRKQELGSTPKDLSPSEAKRREQVRTGRRDNKVSWKLYSVRSVAKQRGVSCDLTYEWIEERISAGVCELSGLPFDLTIKRGPNTPSIDRIDPYGPYSQQNCRMILWSINHALSDRGEDYMLAVFGAILRRMGWKSP